MTTIANSWRGRIIRYAPLILWTGVIFFFSSAAGNTSSTSLIIRPLLLWLFPDITEDSLYLAHYLVRKTGHFVGYGILAFFAWRALNDSSVVIVRDRHSAAAMLYALIISVCDEINQNFHDERTSSAWDVALDCSGAFTMLVFIFAFKKFLTRN